MSDWSPRSSPRSHRSGTRGCGPWRWADRGDPGAGALPDWIYQGGHEPDPRFTFANERTFLAWIRTSLALLAADVAVRALELPLDATVQHLLALALALLGLICAVASWCHWVRAERALRRGEPLPGTPVSVVLSLGLVVCTVLLLSGL